MNRRLRVLCFAFLLLPLGASAIRAGEPAPAFTAKRLDGADFDLAAHRGEVVILNFWAIWCVPCRVELPAFDAFYAAHREDGLTVIAISMDDPELRARVTQLSRDYRFPAAMVGDVQAAGYGRIWRLPITFVIDRRGVLRVDGGVGEGRPYDLPALEREVGPLLKEILPR